MNFNLKKILSGRKALAVIFILAIFLRLIWMIFSVDVNNIQVWEYEEIANNILDGKGYVVEHLGQNNRVFGPPLYPFFCAFIYLLTAHNQIILILIQIIISSFTPLIIYLITKNNFGKLIGVISSLLIVFHPGIIIYSVKLHPLTIDIFLLSILILAILNAEKRMNINYFLLLGLIIGLNLYSRSAIIIFIVINLSIFIFYKGFKREKAILSLFSLLIAFLFISPWVIRNYSIFKELVFIQNSGEVFWRGNNINATGSSFAADGKPIFDSSSEDFRLKILSASNELEQDKIFWHSAFDFIQNNPSKFFKLFITKFLVFWWFYPQQGLEYPQIYLHIYQIFYIICIIMGLIGFCTVLGSEKDDPKTFLLTSVILFVSISIAHSLFYVEGRHRWQIEPILLIFSSLGVSTIFNYFRTCLKTKR